MSETIVHPYCDDLYAIWDCAEPPTVLQCPLEGVWPFWNPPEYLAYCDTDDFLLTEFAEHELVLGFNLKCPQQSHVPRSGAFEGDRVLGHPTHHGLIYACWEFAGLEKIKCSRVCSSLHVGLWLDFCVTSPRAEVSTDLEGALPPGVQPARGWLLGYTAPSCPPRCWPVLMVRGCSETASSLCLEQGCRSSTVSPSESSPVSDTDQSTPSMSKKGVNLLA